MTTATMTPASAGEAMAMVHAGLGFLATTDAAALGSVVQAETLRGLEQAQSVVTAARISMLSAFTAGQGYVEDGTYSARAWLIYHTAVTESAATAHVSWVRRGRAHPRVHAAMIAREVSEPWARVICGWTGKLPRNSQDAADGILLAAAASGLGLPDLAALAAEMWERSRQHASAGRGRDGDHGPAPDPGGGTDPGHSSEAGLGTDGHPGADASGAGEHRPGDSGPGGEGPDGSAGNQDGSAGDQDGSAGDQDGDDMFGDRLLRLAVTFGGAAVLHGDLTPACAQVVKTVLDALASRAGPEDDRSHEERYHDALQEAMTRLVAAGLVPQRAGQPVKIVAHTTLADLMLLEGSRELRDKWFRQSRIRWAGYRRPAARVRGDDGGAWLDGDAVGAVGCDARVHPVVWGQVDPSAFADLVRLSAALDMIYRRGQADAEAVSTARHRTDADGGADSESAGGAGALFSQEALEQAIIGKAVDLLSGPGGLASVLRRQQLGGRLASVSLPLDIGRSSTIPASIRNLVVRRDRHCRFPGCRRPADVCEVHHVRHQAHGGHTSVTNCVLLCWYHHQIAIHRQGWTLKLNPDGTTTAWNKDRSRILHSHSPPARTG